MKSVLVLTCFDVETDSRPKRMVCCLKEKYKVTFVGRGSMDDKEVEFIEFNRPKARNIVEKIRFVVNSQLKHYESMLWTDEKIELLSNLSGRKFDLIISHDLVLLPLVEKIRNHAKVIFDAREYYPRHYESSIIWRLLYQRLNRYLCSHYMKLCDKLFTVSMGIASEYRKEFGIECEVIQSWPDYHDLLPTDVDPENIRIIYHGGINPNRKIENIIRMMDHTDERFSLDLMLLKSPRKYYQYLKREVVKHPRVRIVEAVKHEQLVTTTNQYDIGIFFSPPVTFNLAHALPNKLFEYIQSRLAVAIGPSEDMKEVVETYDVGVVANNFAPKSMAELLNSLSTSQIKHYKQQSHIVASKKSSKENCQYIHEIISGLITS